MTTTPSLALSRREAAIAAALTGTVVVVLGYASGLGLTVEAPSAAQPPLQPAPPAAVAPTEPAMTMPMEPTMPPMATMPAMPVMPVDPMDDMPMPTEPTEPTEPPATEPTEPPAAEPDPIAEERAKCPPALLGQLPVVSPVTKPVGSLLSSLVGSIPLLGELAAPSSDGTPGTIGCVLGTVLGPQCCGTEATVPTRVGQ